MTAFHTMRYLTHCFQEDKHNQYTMVHTVKLPITPQVFISSILSSSGLDFGTFVVLTCFLKTLQVVCMLYRAPEKRPLQNDQFL